MAHFLNFINGKWVDSPQSIEVEDPATQIIIGTVACAKEAEVNQAVMAARACVDRGDLSKPRPAQRVSWLLRIADEILKLKAQGAPLLVAENGKTLSDAFAEFENAARYFQYYAGMADKIEGRSIPLGEDFIDFTIYEPLGVSAQIVPWNFPVDIAARSLAPALAAGNAVVIKSPELTPLAITLLAKACENAQLPVGAVNMICGYGHEAGTALVGHGEIDQIVFTGSVPTGQSILRAAADRALPCVMELGGKSAAVVFPDADLDVFIDSVDWGIFFNGGQGCSAMSRVLVHQDIHAQVVSQVTALAKQQVVGHGSESSTTLTPVSSLMQRNKVIELCAASVQQGAHIVTGGRAVDRLGYFVEPTIIDGVSPENDLFREEVFGPVLAITTFSTEEEAWQLANATDFGLVNGIFTNDLNIALRGAKALKCGQVFVNEWYAGGVETPFGGVKMSGYGREKGQEALYSYVQTKNVAIKLI
ncbi:MAG TPA: aldehyde dehydrogenase [Gammaproteobacteria bacterium]|nr:aldehyde dehydrogenase [Gammaproteobacteria bacterium]